MNDITLISVPHTIIEVPPLGIAVLKGAVESEGFTCKTLDLGMELYKSCQGDRVFFDLLQNYFSAPSKDADPAILHTVERFVSEWAHRLVDSNSRWIGISVFSYYSHLASFLLGERIKQINPNQKIVIGGAGINTKIRQELWSSLAISPAEKHMSCGDVFKKRKLADVSILGDGEQALIDLLSQDKIADVFHMESYRTKDHPFANFDDFDLGAYQGQLNRGQPQLPIFSSKGCVRNCDFCDVNVIQNRFRFRNGKNIVEEMIYLADRYNLRDFVFQDSLVNGSLKSLKEWVTALAEYNLANPDRRITWSASGWICRPIGQIPESFYPILAQSGLQSATIGMETGSNNVLEAMNKKTTIEALYYEVEQFRKNNIKFIGLVMVGHWNEQWEDFLDTAVMIYRLSRYVRTGNLVAINPGTTFSVMDDTPADRNFTVNRLVQHASKNIWWTDLNPSLTAKERYFRLILLERLMHELKVPLMEQVLPYVKVVVENNLAEMKKFYATMTSQLPNLPKQHSEYYHNNFDRFLELVVKRSGINNRMDLSLELESSVTNNDAPSIEIRINDQIIWSDQLDEGTHQIHIDQIELKDLNRLTLHFSNKQAWDTLVDQHGTIVKDKFVKINKFVVNGFDLCQDVEFFYNHLQYQIDGQPTSVSPGFWFNDSCLILEFSNPFDLWYSQTSNRFAQFDGRIVTQTTLPNRNSITDFSQFKPQLIQLLQQMQY